MGESQTRKLPPLVVKKFGGSSLATPEQIVQVASGLAEIAAESRLVVVVSAMGNATDDLVDLAHEVTAQPDRRELDMLLSAGERISMSLMTMALQRAGLAAVSLTGSQAGIMTDAQHSNAQIQSLRPTRLKEELQRGRVVVLAGFQGVCPETKDVTTLGRGGSDTTAVAMAAELEAARCEICKDVDGVYTADPRLVPTARHLPRLNYNHLMEMTFWGSQVLHYRAVELAQRRSVALEIKASHLSVPIRSTQISKEAPLFEQFQLLAVNSHHQVWPLHLLSTDLTTGLATLRKALEKNHLPWPQILSSEQSNDSCRMWIAGPEEMILGLRALSEQEPGLQLGSTPLASVTLTAHGAVSNDVPVRAMECLKDKGISTLHSLHSGASVTFFVPAPQRDTAIQVLHKKFIP